MAKQVQLQDFEMCLGCFGRFFSQATDGKYYAVKFMKKHEIIKLKQVDHINNEKRLMAQISYPFIVNMQDDHFVYIIMECISGGELFTHLRRARKFSDEQSKFYGLQTAAAFAHIHGKNIIHRDLKPENILLCPNGYSKLTDFGFAKIVEPGTRTYTLCGTPEYIAPEVLLNKGHGKPVDWWTLGILVYEMICGQPPFCDEDPMGIYQKILAGKVYFPKYFDKNAKSLVKKLLVADLSKRFGNLKDGAADILQSKWFSTYELPKMEAMEYPAPYKPSMKDDNDVSNFEDIPDSTDMPPKVTAAQDLLAGDECLPARTRTCEMPDNANIMW
ncbi:cAMP-dependent protein kinase catalytic subunit (Dd GPK2) (DdPK3) [Durusdinium trenchii]|uniref:cAMP-dependent protein kinase catalytic subunit (Dd GPK2) (DdPK3) n=1 Tax=Durusdinium trenchii TaxID=1381693 RepID=A0ABP0SDE1_9DINO